MNSVVLIGRMTKDPEIRYSQNGGESMAVARFALAVDRKKKDAGADFIGCVAFGKTAETIEKYCNKGKKLGIIGHIQTGSYEKDGAKVYTTDVIVDQMEFVESKSSEETSAPRPAQASEWQNVDESIQETLPFN